VFRRGRIVDHLDVKDTDGQYVVAYITGAEFEGSAQVVFNLGIPFFLPVWRRVLVVVVAIAWGLLEFANGQFFWGIVFVGMGSIATWKFG